MGDIFDEVYGIQQPAISNTPIPKQQFADVFDEVYAGQPAPQPKAQLPSLFNDPIGALTSSDWWTTRPSGEKISAGQAVVGPVSKALDALTFGFGDEITAGGNSLLDALSGQNIGEAYDQRLNQIRGVESSFDQAAPAASTALQIAASLKNPMIMASKIGQVTGLGSKAIQAAKEGALIGGLYGFGEGEGVSDRATSAVLSGAIGGTAGAVLAPAIDVGSNAILNALSRKAGPIDRQIAMQRGSINLSGKPTNIPGGYSPEELILAEQLKNTPIDQVKRGSESLGAAISKDSPVFLPEAVDSPKVFRNARMIANYDPSLEFSQKTIANRTAGAESRGVGYLDIVSPDNSIFSGARKLTGAADDMIKLAESAREEQAFPLYKEAYATFPKVTDSTLPNLIENDKVLQQAIASVKKTANNANLGEDSPQLLVKARQEISNQIDAALSQGYGRKARDLTDTYNRLNNILHRDNPLLQKADEAYSGASTLVNELKDSFIGNLAKISDDKVNNISQLFNLPKEQISGLRSKFEQAGKLDSWNAGVRAHLQKTIEGSKKGKNFVDDIIGNTLQEGKLKAAIGDGPASTLIDDLQREGKMFEGKNKYFAGSSTKGNFEEVDKFEQSTGILAKLFKADFKGALSALFPEQALPEKTAQGLAKIYFDPKTGKGSLERIMPLLQAYKRNEIISGALGDAASKVSGVQLGPKISEQLQGKQKQPQGLYRSQPPQSAQSKTLQEASAKQVDPSSVPRDDTGRFIKHTSANLKSTQAKIRTALLESSDQINGNITKGRSMTKDPKIAAIEARIDADPVDSTIFEMESGRNWQAKNPNSTASGGFQLIKSTAKALGVTDVFDPEQNYEGYLKLKKEADRLATKPEDYYAVHFLGAPTFKKWKNGGYLNEQQQEQVDFLESKLIPKFKRIYAQKLKNKSGMVEA